MELTAKDVSVRIDHKTIIDGISLHVPDRQFCALLSPNGSGKSTFLKTVYRIMKPDAGVIMLNQRSLAQYGSRELAREMAVVGQFNAINFDYSVFDIVLMGRTPHLGLMAREKERDYALAEEALQKVGMIHCRDRSYQSLSGGEKQRVILARALTQEPKILILDEPTNHLDIRYQMETLSIIRHLGITVLTALHDLNLAIQFCDYLYMIKDGRIAAHGAVAEVLSKQMIRQIYDIDADIFPSPIDGRLMVEYHA